MTVYFTRATAYDADVWLDEEPKAQATEVYESEGVRDTGLVDQYGGAIMATNKGKLGFL